MNKSERRREYEKIGSAITMVQLNNAMHYMNLKDKAKDPTLFSFGKFMESLSTVCVMNMLAVLESGGSTDDAVESYFDMQEKILKGAIGDGDVSKQWDPTEVERVRSGFGILDDAEDSGGD